MDALCWEVKPVSFVHENCLLCLVYLSSSTWKHKCDASARICLRLPQRAVLKIDREESRGWQCWLFFRGSFMFSMAWHSWKRKTSFLQRREKDAAKNPALMIRCLWQESHFFQTFCAWEGKLLFSPLTNSHQSQQNAFRNAAPLNFFLVLSIQTLLNVRVDIVVVMTSGCSGRSSTFMSSETGEAVRWRRNGASSGAGLEWSSRQKWSSRMAVCIKILTRMSHSRSGTASSCHNR